MKTNAVIQALLMLAIAGLLFLVIRVSRFTRTEMASGLEKLAETPAPSTTADADDGTTPSVRTSEDAKPGDSFAFLGQSKIFETIIPKPTPPPPPPARVVTPPPPPEIAKVIDSEKWRLMGVTKDKVFVERGKFRDTFQMKVGESRTIPFGRIQCDLQLTGVNMRQQEATFQYGDQSYTMKTF